MPVSHVIPLQDRPPDLPPPGPPRLAGTSCWLQSLSQTVGTSDPASGLRADSGNQAPQTRAADTSASSLSSEARAQSPDGAGLHALGAPREGASRLVLHLGLPRPRPPPPASAPLPHSLPGCLLLGGLRLPCPRGTSLPWITPAKTPWPGRLLPRTGAEEVHSFWGDSLPSTPTNHRHHPSTRSDYPLTHNRISLLSGLRCLAHLVGKRGSPLQLIKSQV